VLEPQPPRYRPVSHPRTHRAQADEDCRTCPNTPQQPSTLPPPAGCRAALQRVLLVEGALRKCKRVRSSKATPKIAFSAFAFPSRTSVSRERVSASHDAIDETLQVIEMRRIA
jgi:hypothetical protein